MGVGVNWKAQPCMGRCMSWCMGGCLVGGVLIPPDKAAHTHTHTYSPTLVPVYYRVSG